MARMTVRARHGITALLLVLAAVLAGCTRTPGSGWGEIAPSRFLAVANAAFGGPHGIVTVDARSGRTKPFPLHLSAAKSLAVTGMAFDQGRNLWVSSASGPVCTSRVAGCGPQQHSCAGQIERIDRRSGTSRVVYRATREERIDGVSPNPSADQIAFLTGQCDRSYLNQHIRVQRVGGRAFDVGAGLLVCHRLAVPVWLSGDRLAAVYQPASSTTIEPEYGHGVCSTPARGGVAVFAAAPTPDLPPPTSLDPECQPAAIASTPDGLDAIVACGPEPGLPYGPAKLIVTDQTLHARQTTPVGSCTNGASIAADHIGDIAMSTYDYCGRPGEDPHTVVFVVKKGAARTLSDLRGGTLALDHLAW